MRDAICSYACNTLQYTAAHVYTLQRCNPLKCAVIMWVTRALGLPTRYNTLKHNETLRKIPQHAATRYNALTCAVLMRVTRALGLSTEVVKQEVVTNKGLSMYISNREREMTHAYIHRCIHIETTGPHLRAEPSC